MMLVATALVLLTAVVVTSQQTSDYCSLSRQHTLCRNPNPNQLGQACGARGESLGLSLGERREVMDYHNRLRSRVARGQTRQPPASNMKELVWDDELARVAQGLADQCKFAHDCPKCRRVSRFKVGQNLYQSFTTRQAKTDWRAAIDSWYDEIDQFPVSSVKRYAFSHATGHYSQLMWGDTDRIGCGMSGYTKGRFNIRLYACNYGETGNVIRRPVYKVGRSCTSCPCSTSCSLDYPGLCSASNSTTDLLCMLNRPVEGLMNINQDLAHMTMNTAMDTFHTAMDTAHGVGNLAMDTATGVGNLAMAGVQGGAGLAITTANEVTNLGANFVQDSANFVRGGFTPVRDFVSNGVNFAARPLRPALTFPRFLFGNNNNFFGRR